MSPVEVTQTSEPVHQYGHGGFTYIFQVNYAYGSHDLAVFIADTVPEKDRPAAARAAFRELLDAIKSKVAP